jgi:HAD superfamily hydrolase (TIGR01509 family)
MRPSAVLFDYNGTISLDEELHEEVWGRAFRQVGLPWSRELFFTELIGHPADEQALLGVRLLTGRDDPELAAQARGAERRLLAVAREGWSGISLQTVEVVRRVAAHAKVAVVTSCRRDVLVSELGAVGLLEEVDVLVAAEDVLNHKPHPEPYLQALSTLGLEARQAVAVEDSQPGIVSAKAAGLRVIVVGELSASGIEDAAARSLTEPSFWKLLGLEAGPS